MKPSPTTPGVRYRKRPVEVEAVQWFSLGDHPKVERPWSKKSDYRCPHCGGAWGVHGVVRTLEDTQDSGHFVCPGDWIIKGVKGEHYACKPDIFTATYEPAFQHASESAPPIQAHSKSEYKRLSAQGANVVPPSDKRMPETPLTAARARPASWFKGDVRVVEADFASELELARDALFKENAALRASPEYVGVPTTGPLSLDNDRQVFFYEQDHYYLSNFSAFQVEYGDRLFDTAEQAYHFQRFKSGVHRHGILFATSAHEAFRYAQDHKAEQIPEWDKIKVDVMRLILNAKVSQHEYVRRKLLQTGDRELIENSWRDPFWGWGPNRDGNNMLGKLWMEVRAEMRACSTISGGE